ncbi:hypothetical protein HDV06_004015 [Boothiomyces sp. JEL0866]|nr:hypothetical protein HDV06_004015 [Boothiomyces sp. JEL0866]
MKITSTAKSRIIITIKDVENIIYNQTGFPMDNEILITKQIDFYITIPFDYNIELNTKGKAMINGGRVNSLEIESGDLSISNCQIQNLTINSKSHFIMSRSKINYFRLINTGLVEIGRCHINELEFNDNIICLCNDIQSYYRVEIGKGMICVDGSLVIDCMGRYQINC